MLYNWVKKISGNRFAVNWFSWLLICLWLIIGCSAVTGTVKDTTKTVTKTTRKIVREVTFAGDGLKKTIGVVEFENKALQASPEFKKLFHNDLIAHFNDNCADIIVVGEDLPENPGHLTSLPKLANGETDNYALAIIGRQLGLNFIVAGSLNNIRPRDEERGILWTKDTHFLIEVLIMAQVYDTQTATKILDESFLHEVEIDELDYRLIEKDKADTIPQLNEAFAQILVEMGDRICEVVSEQLWSGQVTAVAGEKISISGGSRIGLETGDVLEVFDSGRILEGIDGQKFFAPGLKTAEIRITAVADSSADAVKVSGRGLKAGSIVRKK